MEKHTLLKVLEGLDYFYDPKDPRTPNGIYEKALHLIEEMGAKIVLPYKMSGSKILVNGYNTEVASKDEDADFESAEEAFNKFCEGKDNTVHARKRLFIEMTKTDMDEVEVAKILNFISNKVEMEWQEYGNFLLLVAELYFRRNLIELIDQTFVGMIPMTDVTKLDLFIYLDIAEEAKGYLKQGVKLDCMDSALKLMVLLEPDTNDPIAKAFCKNCLKYLELFNQKECKLLLPGKITMDHYRDIKPVASEPQQLCEHLSMTGYYSKALESLKVQNDIQIVNITMSTFDSELLFVKESSELDSIIKDIIKEMKEVEVESGIKRYGNLTCEIEPSDVFKLSHSKRIANLISTDCNDGSKVNFVANHLNLDLVCKDKLTSEILLITLMKEGQLILSPNDIKKLNNKEDRCPTLSITRLKFKSPEMMTYNMESEDFILTEGLKISEDGGIKLTYTPKKSYMDEYAEVHKVLHENSKAGNYQAMKTDLAFLFAFINHIESQVIYSNKPVSTSKKEDAIKARMFAINDFKTYLKIVQQHESHFDFSKYFEGLDQEKVLVEFSNSEIKGIRKLLRTILNV